MASLIRKSMSCDVFWDPGHEWYETLEEETARKNWKPCPKRFFGRWGRKQHQWEDGHRTHCSNCNSY